METKNINKLLIASCKRGDIEGAELAIKGGADIEYEDEDEIFPDTPLDISAYHSHKKLVKLLVSYDVEVSNTAMDFAIDRRDFGMFQVLLNGDLSEVIWAMLFHSLGTEMCENNGDKVLEDIYWLIQDKISTSLSITHV